MDRICKQSILDGGTGFIKNKVEDNEGSPLFYQTLCEVSVVAESLSILTIRTSGGGDRTPLSWNNRSRPRFSSRLNPKGDKLTTSPTIPTRKPKMTALYSRSRTGFSPLRSFTFRPEREGPLSISLGRSRGLSFFLNWRRSAGVSPSRGRGGSLCWKIGSNPFRNFLFR
jgi:hypothetical protein